MNQISVIVPVYNGEQYLRECIDSILCQSFSDFELILVDDGSSDNSGIICDDYATKDKRVKVIHKINEGINATRKRGVMEAQGYWIAFCDNDDSMPLDALSNLFELTENTDIVIGFPDVPNYNKTLTLDECRRNIITAKLLPPSPWGKLYRRVLLTEDIFDFPREIDGEEDMIMNIRLMFKVNRAPKICFKKVYNFRRNPLSVSHTKQVTLEHEDIFNKTRSSSIPSAMINDYTSDIIRSRLNGIIGIAYCHPETIVDWKHPYLLDLKHKIRENHFKLRFQESLLLSIKKKGILKLFAFFLLIINALKYRLGKNN